VYTTNESASDRGARAARADYGIYTVGKHLSVIQSSALFSKLRNGVTHDLSDDVYKFLICCS
jgi:hypothetical protein